MSTPISQFILLPTYPLVTIVFFPHPCLYFCFVSKFISTFFFRFYISVICRDIFPMDSLRTKVSFYRPSLGFQSLSFPFFFPFISQRGKTPFRMFTLVWGDLHLIEN